MMFNPFMSKEKKAMRAKMALRQCIRSLQRWERSLDKKKEEMIKLGQEARRQGIKDQYTLAVKGLKMIMGQQLRSKKMQLQLQLVETMRDLAHVNNSFVSILGNVGREVEKVAGQANFVKNQMAFEQGMFSIEGMMDQLDGFMADNDQNLASEAGLETISDSDIERLFDIPQAQGTAATDPRIADWEQKIKGALNGEKAEG